jgi:hypothetical protein
MLIWDGLLPYTMYKKRCKCKSEAIELTEHTRKKLSDIGLDMTPKAQETKQK